MLLDIGGLDQTMRQVGIGIASQDTNGGVFNYRQTDTTIDLAATSNTQPYLTGVVFHDAAGNGEYQPGEGLAGVTITVAGVGSTTTMDAGGYAIPLAPGTYTITASGGGLAAPIARTVVVRRPERPARTSTRIPTGRSRRGPVRDGQRVARDIRGDRRGRHAGQLQARIDWGDGNATRSPR